MCSAGGSSSLLLRRDSSAVACGSNGMEEIEIPPLASGTCYTQASARGPEGGGHSVLLHNDGNWECCCLRI